MGRVDFVETDVAAVAVAAGGICVVKPGVVAAVGSTTGEIAGGFMELVGLAVAGEFVVSLGGMFTEGLVDSPVAADGLSGVGAVAAWEGSGERVFSEGATEGAFISPSVGSVASVGSVMTGPSATV